MRRTRRRRQQDFSDGFVLVLEWVIFLVLMMEVIMNMQKGMDMFPEFRKLNANEIDCRIAKVNKAYITLLLYKDARVDQNILDETVGRMNWQRHHSRENANCIVSIWDADKVQWIEKEDTGTESNTEAVKGLASDSFKRACFNFLLHSCD